VTSDVFMATDKHKKSIYVYAKVDKVCMLSAFSVVEIQQHHVDYVFVAFMTCLFNGEFSVCTSALFQAISRSGFLMKLSFLKPGDDPWRVGLVPAARSGAEQRRKVPGRFTMHLVAPETVDAGERGVAVAGTAASGRWEMPGKTGVNQAMPLLHRRRIIANRLRATLQRLRRLLALTKVSAAF